MRLRSAFVPQVPGITPWESMQAGSMSEGYSLVIDARSLHGYAEDPLPGAVNLPVLDDEPYAEVGIRNKTDKHGATGPAISVDRVQS